MFSIRTICTILAAGAMSGWASGQALSGSFDILTYNVAGLPEPISGSDPAVNTPLISQRLSNYSIVHVQEDFGYHSELLSSDTHFYRTSHSGNVPLGNGLNALSSYPWSDHQRRTWAACWPNSGDCLAAKGFTAMRIQLDDGVVVDFYNLHAEAGDDKLDFQARTVGFQQMSNFIGTYSLGNAVVVAGDTNTRYTSSQDPARLLKEKNGLADVWVELFRGGNPPGHGGSIECRFPVPAGQERMDCEQIDKVHYRGNRLLRLAATDFINQNTAFLTASGGPLSDHFPNQAVFDYELSPSMRAGPRIVGGTHSTWFNDATGGSVGSWGDATARAVVSSITLRGGSRVDKVAYTMSDGRKIPHGGSGGGDRTLKLDAGENINRVEVCIGVRSGGSRGVFSVTVDTDRGRSVRTGSGTGECEVWTPPSGGTWTLVGFQGWTGSEVDALGVVWGKR